MLARAGRAADRISGRLGLSVVWHRYAAWDRNERGVRGVGSGPVSACGLVLGGGWLNRAGAVPAIVPVR